ncbi:MAG TPA: 23S rRNA (pseudouridine(1915)-N(3))-methyltransferase RlmH [Rhodopila sp.]
MHLIAIGRLRAGPEQALLDRYTARLRPPPTMLELPEARGSAAVIKRKEATALLDAVPRDAFAVALDQGGQALNSEAFAARLDQWSSHGRRICFMIGGAEGLDAQVIDRADYVLSFGPMTWPHLLARVMLAEQLYRAQSIAQRHPYHRAGRPGD